MRIELWRAAGKVEDRDLARPHDLDDHARDFPIHDLLPRRPGIDMTVLTGLVASIAEIDLQRFQFTTVQPRKIGVLE